MICLRPIPSIFGHPQTKRFLQKKENCRKISLLLGIYCAVTIHIDEPDIHIQGMHEDDGYKVYKKCI